MYLGLFLDFLFCFTGLSTHAPAPQCFNGLIFGRINPPRVAFLFGALMAVLVYVFFYTNFRITSLVKKKKNLYFNWDHDENSAEGELTAFYDDVVPYKNIFPVFLCPLEMLRFFSMSDFHISD